MINKRKNKKGISEVVGYILLVSFAIFMSFIVYQGLKTYVPVKAVECPEGVSIFIDKVSCTLNGNGNYDLKFTIKNNGRYNIVGYYIHGSDDPDQSIATFPLISYLREIKPAITNMGTWVRHEINVSNSSITEFEDIPSKLYSIDILPTRIQKEDNRLRTVSCEKARVREEISCN